MPSGQRGKWAAPKSYEEVHRNWRPVAVRLARRWGLSPDACEDFGGQVVEEFCSGGYLDLYDPELGAFSTYWFSFCNKRLRRNHSKSTRDPIDLSTSLEWENEDGSMEDRFPELQMTMDPLGREMFKQALKEALDALAKFPPEQSRRGSDGQFRTRSLLVVFNMLVREKSRKEIAEYLLVTEGTISSMVAAIQKVPEVQRLREYVNGER